MPPITPISSKALAIHIPIQKPRRIPVTLARILAGLEGDHRGTSGSVDKDIGDVPGAQRHDRFDRRFRRPDPHGRLRGGHRGGTDDRMDVSEGGGATRSLPEGIARSHGGAGLPYISYGRRFSGMVRIAERALDRECERLNPSMTTGPSLSTRPKNHKKGEERWKQMQAELEEVFPECWNLQMAMVQAIFRACIRRIFMEELEMDIENLVNKCDLTLPDLANLVVILAPRRFGKTVSLAVAIAVLLICIPGFISVHFPIKLEEGPRLITDVLKYVQKSARGRALLAASPKQRKYHIELVGPDGDVRSCRILAASDNALASLHTCRDDQLALPCATKMAYYLSLNQLSDYVFRMCERWMTLMGSTGAVSVLGSDAISALLLLTASRRGLTRYQYWRDLDEFRKVLESACLIIDAKAAGFLLPERTHALYLNAASVKRILRFCEIFVPRALAGPGNEAESLDPGLYRVDDIIRDKPSTHGFLLLDGITSPLERLIPCVDSMYTAMCPDRFKMDDRERAWLSREGNTKVKVLFDFLTQTREEVA